MDKKQTLKEIRERVKSNCANDSTGHDWNHINRVRQNAIKIAKTEGGDIFIIELAALLHDVEDWKSTNAGSGLVNKLLKDVNIDEESSKKINDIISKISFKGVNHDDKMDTVEGKIVQDADRLDALGATGIIRSVLYGASNGIPLYDPLIKPDPNASAEKIKRSTTINHFYEKLLLLKDRMNTATAKRMAVEKHAFMELFLKQFYREWET